MKKFILIVLSLIALIVLFGVVWFFTFAPKQNTPGTNSPITLPVSGTVPGGTGVSTSPATESRTVRALQGGVITTNDFINNGVTLSDATNKGRYLLAGDLGYCVTAPQKCRAGTQTDFNVFYDSTNDAFTIGLLKEPLGATRIEVERFLENTLGISASDMCRLNYYVGTTYQVNALYSTKNLGFSFCPGATALPK